MTCRECGSPMRSQCAPNDGRPTHHARGLCKRCYSAARRTRTVDQWPRIQGPIDAADLIEDVEWMQETRTHPEWWAPRVGMTPEALSQRLYRAGRRDLATQVDQVIRQMRNAA